MHRTLRWLAIPCLLLSFGGCDILSEVLFGPGSTSRSWVLRWNMLAIDTSGLDHTPVQAGETRTFGHQLGPTRASRAMAIVHIAMFEAVNAIVGDYQSYLGIPAATEPVSMKAAIAQAAHDSLVGMYPSHADRLDAELATDLAQIPDDASKTSGIALGMQTAAAILANRAGDGSDVDNPYVFGNDPGDWRVDPLNPGQTPLGDDWYLVAPFVMTRANQFRSPPPPAINSAEYAAAYDQVKMLGGDGVTTPTIRTNEQSMTGTFWAYDGTPSLCAPPRLYNQIVTRIATDRQLDVVELSRLLALTNVAMADAAIAIWESKYFYNFWRPVTGIRESDPGTGPSGLGDDNALTIGDPTYTPLGAPASNDAGTDFTPPFPAYPSGHAGFGGALFQTMRHFFGTDDIAFTFVSDEFNGVTVDSQGNTRPLVPRSFTSLSQAEEENGQSRIYLGIHWEFDKSEGIVMGNRVADYVFENLYPSVH
jgi:hypothetical protein